MNKKSSRIFSIVTLLVIQFLSVSAIAKPDFFEQRYRGWLWFEERKKIEEETKTPEELPAMPTLEQMQRAKKENEKFARELELLRHLVVRYPDNLEYIRLYKLKEKMMMDDAQTLGANWLMVNFLNPEIINELEHPQNIYGRDILRKEKKGQNKLILTILSQKVELFVFRQDDCPYCATLEKHLNNFASKYGFKVEAISPDNSQSNYFKTNSAPELISALGLSVMPTVIAVVNDSRQRFELARGAVSVADLEDKALLLAEYLENQAINKVRHSEYQHNEQGQGEQKPDQYKQHRQLQVRE